MGFHGWETVLRRGNSKQRSGEDSLRAKVQKGYERGHKTFSIYNRSAQLECGIWVGLGPGFKEKKLKQFSSTSHENKSQEEAAQMLVHNAQAPNNKYP